MSKPTITITHPEVLGITQSYLYQVRGQVYALYFSSRIKRSTPYLLGVRRFPHGLAINFYHKDFTEQGEIQVTELEPLGKENLAAGYTYAVIDDRYGVWILLYPDTITHTCEESIASWSAL